MSYTGPWQGADNGTYRSAREFFARVDALEKKPKAKKARTG